MAMMPAPAMPAALMMPEGEEMPEEQGAGDLSQGYTLELSVLPDGTFKVGDPQALAVEAAEDRGAVPGGAIGQDFSSIGEALKAVLMKIKANPMGGSDQKAFEAGYGAG